MHPRITIDPPAYLIPLGTEVFVGGDIPAIVTALTITPGKVRYEATWWDGRVRRQEWFESMEIVTRGPSPGWLVVRDR